ncbi:uncharacterized protein LOC136069316 [Quercus suber]|uniref:uncharacterized protein LOC136069316 n=1 Tax=Quercus suber TaxID=58331 RepID=UPI0032DFA298
MSRTLNQISKLPFTRNIEGAILPRRFHQPTFTIYNGRTDLVEHVSHFNQRMVVHSKNEALMCKVFPSSLGLMAMRWFDSLRGDSISSFKELTQAFGSRFITCSSVPRPLDSLLSMSMREGEIVKAYSDRYWEMFNEIDGDFDDVVISTFEVGLLAERGLRKSLTGKPVTSSESTNTQAINAVFREPVHQILEKINNESFFRWTNNMARNPIRRNQSLYCHHHQDQGHTTEDYRNLWDHLDQLVREGKLKQLLHHFSGQGGQINSEPQRDDSSRLPLGTINVIFAASGRTRSYPSRVMSVARLPTEDANLKPKRARIEIQPILGFSDQNKIKTIQPHDDTLVVILRIGGYDVKKVLVD